MVDGRDVPDATFACPGLTTFTRLDELGLEVVGQRLEPDCAVLACRVVDVGDWAGWCRRCGREEVPHDSVTRRLAHEPFGCRPTTLLVTVRRYRCTGCGHVCARTPAVPLSRGRNCRVAGCGGRWKGSWSSTSPLLVWPTGLGCRGTPAGPCTPEPACSPTSRLARLRKLFASDAYVEVEATWGIYQRMIAAYREPDRARGRELMVQVHRSESDSAGRCR